MNEGESTDSSIQESGDKKPSATATSTNKVTKVQPLLSLFAPPPQSAEEAEDNVERFMSHNENTIKRMNTKVLPTTSSGTGEEDVIPDNILDSIHFRSVTPTDLPTCKTLLLPTRHGKQFSSHHSALTQQLQYRQHHAAQYFRCAVLWDHNDATASLSRGGTVIGLVMATRSSSHQNFHTPHDATGKILIIHAFCIEPKYQKKGIGQRMLANYVQSMKQMRLRYGIQKLVMRVHETWLMIWLVQKLQFSVQQYVEEEPIHKNNNKHNNNNNNDNNNNDTTTTNNNDAADGGDDSSSSQHSGGYYLCELNLNLIGTEDSKRKGLPYWVIDSFAHLRAGTGHAMRGSGNPAAVVLIKNKGFDPNDQETVHWMKTVAAEFQHSETAFIWKPTTTTTSNPKNDSVYNIRFYTKDGTEVALCGHATLAASSAVYQLWVTNDPQQQPPLSSTTTTTATMQQQSNKLSFITKDDIVLTTTLAKKEKKNSSGSSSGNNNNTSIINPNKAMKISMEFPAVNVQSITNESDRLAVYKMIQDAFHISEDNLNASVMFMGLHAPTTTTADSTKDMDLLIELSTSAFLNIVDPINYQALTQWNGYGRGVIICCLAPKDTAGGGGNAETSSNCSTGSYGSMCSSIYLTTGGTNSTFDFFSRFFGPKVGIEEDPVTGSAHCLLAPYFSEKLDKNTVIGRQVSSRGGTVECTMKQTKTHNSNDNDDDDIEIKSSVIISGIAVTTMRGTLNIS